MLQQRLYTLLKWVLSLSFADVMCFFISVYLLIRVSEKCQNILFLLLKRRKILDFHRCGIPSYFSFPKQSFVDPHTVISEVYFNNREFILFLVSFLVSSYAFEGHFYILVRHFSFQEYHFCSFKEKQSRKC
jgi:hypothetical protein